MNKATRANGDTSQYGPLGPMAIQVSTGPKHKVPQKERIGLLHLGPFGTPFGLLIHIPLAFFGDRFHLEPILARLALWTILAQVL